MNSISYIAESAVYWRNEKAGKTGINMLIRTKRLTLRPLRLGDFQTVYEYSSDMDNARYMMWLPHETEQETIDFLRGVNAEWQKPFPMFYEFAIVLSGVHIGAVSLYLDDTRTEGEIGWILNKAYQNHGYVTEAATALLGVAKNALKLRCITAHCDWRNTPSARVMEKLGMTLLSDSGQRTYRKRDETAREFTYILEL